MRKLSILIILLLCFSSLQAQEIEHEAPLNPEFIKWQNNILKSGESLDLVPAPILPNNDWIKSEALKKTYAFDAVYDLRPLGFVTRVKDQGACGACWTFGTLGALESAMLKQGFGNFDFSEQNIRTCHGFVLGENETCSGGNNRKSSAYLTRGDGPIQESDVPYDVEYYAECNRENKPQFTIFDVNFYPNEENIIKEAIQTYGALYTNMKWDSDSYRKSQNTFYYDGDESTSHAVLLVGWDDNVLTNGGKGAWIIRNSWGDDWGDNGYFYIAYQDTKINSSAASFHGIERKTEGDLIHMYDKLGWLGSVGYSSGFAQGLIKFTSRNSESITAIGTYATASGATIKANVYLTKSGDILSDLVGSTEYTSFNYAGYHRIDLIEPIDLEAEQDFYIEVLYSTNTYNYPIPFEKAKDDYADPTIESEVAWIRGSSASWHAVGSDIEGKERDLCIRAYAKTNVSGTNSLNIDSKLIHINPQPVHNHLSLSLDKTFLNKKLSIIDMQGKVYNRFDIRDLKSKIYLSDIASGMYFIRIENKNGKLLARKRFIKVE